MHDTAPSQLLLAMREAAERLEGHERQIARAYVAGFACHWLLDSTVHPFVYFWQNGITSAGVPGLDKSAGSRVHAEIERDLDEMVLFSLTGKTVERWRPHERALSATRATLAAVDKVYFYVSLWVFGHAIDPRTFSTSVHEFRLVQRVFDSPRGHKRAAWENPFTHEVSHESFWDLFDGARARVLPVVDELFSPDFDLAAARELTHDLNFEGSPRVPVEKCKGAAW